MPSNRAACLARLSAAASRISLSYFGSSARASGTSGSTFCPPAVLASSVRKAPSVKATYLCRFGVGVVLVELAREQVGELAEQDRIGADLGVVLNQAGQLERHPPVGRGRAQPLDVLHRIALAAGQLAEQEPDDDHHDDDDRRDHEELNHKPRRRRLDRRQVRQGRRLAELVLGRQMGRSLGLARSSGSRGQPDGMGNGYSPSRDRLLLSLGITGRASSNRPWCCHT